MERVIPKPNQTKGIETITNRQSACKWKILFVCESWCMWANKTDVQERINRKILGKLTDNRQMQRHDPTQSMQILENGILHYELRIIACNEQENLYMRWHGMAEKHFCGRSNSYTLYCLVQNACSHWKTYIVLLSFISFSLCVSITIWRWEHVRRYMLWIQYFQWQGIRSLVRNKSKKHTAVKTEWVREIDGKEEKKKNRKVWVKCNKIASLNDPYG